MVDKIEIYVALVSIGVFIRNMLYPIQVLEVYDMWQFMSVRYFMRCSSAYFAGKGEKPWYRMLFFNLIRVMLPEIIVQLHLQGKLNLESL